MIEPIRPSDIAQTKASLFPDFVIKTWNAMIAKKYVDNSATIMQSEILEALAIAGSSTQGVKPTEQYIVVQGWLDIEDIYRAVGWKVVYDGPGFNETYNPSFEFTKKK